MTTDNSQPNASRDPEDTIPPSADGYKIRRFQPGDRGELCSLYEMVFEQPASLDWLNWKYIQSPFIDQVPIVLARRDDRIIGARPFFPLVMRAGEQRILALQPSDAMVHPDHRRQGLFTRMTEHAIEYYSGREPALFFNYPNDKSRPGNLKLGWELVGTSPIYYRIQNPGALVRDAIGDVVSKKLYASTRALTRGVFAAADRFIGPAVSSVSIERHESTPVRELAALYSGAVPDRIHALRDERFYAWRFENPRWEYTTYLARCGGEPIAGLVASISYEQGVKTVRIVDALPMIPGMEDGVIASLLRAILADNAQADLVAVHAGAISHDILRGLGFLRDDQFPLSKLCSPSTLVVRSLPANEEWTLGGRQLIDGGDWQVAFAERDTA